MKTESMKIPFNLSIEDKEDIYEFIFLDLCVELTDEYSINSKVIQKIFSFVKTMNEQSKKQKGFKTNTTAIKDYLYEFISFLKSTLFSS
jgi:DNA primase large subunit